MIRSVLSARVPALLGVRNLCAPLSGIHLIKMPSIMGAKEGQVNFWSFHRGDAFQAGDLLCEISLPSATLGIDAPEGGIMAKILCDKYETAGAGSTIAMYALSQEHYLDFVAQDKMEAEEAERTCELREMVGEKTKEPDFTVLMRTLKHLTRSGKLQAGSELAKSIGSLARRGEPQLMRAFRASFEGSAFNEETFDEDFFLEEAQEIVSDQAKVSV